MRNTRRSIGETPYLPMPLVAPPPELHHFAKTGSAAGRPAADVVRRGARTPARARDKEYIAPDFHRRPKMIFTTSSHASLKSMKIPSGPIALRTCSIMMSCPSGFNTRRSSRRPITGFGTEQKVNAVAIVSPCCCKPAGGDATP